MSTMQSLSPELLAAAQRASDHWARRATGPKSASISQRKVDDLWRDQSSGAGKDVPETETDSSTDRRPRGKVPDKTSDKDKSMVDEAGTPSK